MEEESGDRSVFTFGIRKVGETSFVMDFHNLFQMIVDWRSQKF